MKFIDEAKIFIKAGDGGNGCVSFMRQRFKPNGGPDGGTGGKGGDIVFESSNTKNTLIDFKFLQEYKAKNGIPGRGNNMTGADGEDLVITVPTGTVIRHFSSNEIIADLDTPGKRIIVQRGGKGGLGNSCFANSSRQAPMFAQEGEKVEGYWIKIELKLLADVGLVGLPNAGKSTLISRMSSAKPKIADYPFTTLVPNLGVVNYSGVDFVIADVPGLIKDAHKGAGLGIKFLKHIERTKVLVHVVDLSPTIEDPVENIEIINNELKQFGVDPHSKQMIYALNKIDVAEPETLDKIKKYMDKIGADYVETSGVSNKGLDVLTKKLVGILGKKDNDTEDNAFRGDI